MSPKNSPASPDHPGRESSWISEVLEEHERSLVALAQQILGDLDRARDVVQETFLRLCRMGPAERAEVEDHLTPWLFTVCRNRALDVKAKEKPMTTTGITTGIERPSPEPGPDATAEGKDEIDHVLGCVDALPDNQREVLRLKFRHGLSYREISGVTELSVSNVGFLIHQGLKSLRERLAGAPATARQSIEGTAS
jgi:RNA polymerase sigma factor (sigma-70 family)